MQNPRILIAGIGNIFLGDDGFGVEVARRLVGCRLPEGARVADFGIRGLDLAYTLLDAQDDVTILADACPRGGTPGSLYLLEPDLNSVPDQEAGPIAFQGHGMNPERVLQMVRLMNGRIKRVLVVGCEPEKLGFESTGLSKAVEAAADEAVDLVASLAWKIAADGAQVKFDRGIAAGGESRLSGGLSCA